MDLKAGDLFMQYGNHVYLSPAVYSVWVMLEDGVEGRLAIGACKHVYGCSDAYGWQTYFLAEEAAYIKLGPEYQAAYALGGAKAVASMLGLP